ncbi:hypothetical protein TNCV_3650651 [Trichonephila clavipes]|uniref:Uncharacterized protein n=1 Tax=Trichonephila clavipes TaxID=2585209 RepID=A0A8X6SA02_TRICX|nr:hypothetical protein TNCV_3650651 [Trichonephila clavipes]
MEKNYTKTGKLKRASYEKVSRWVLKAWNDVAETTASESRSPSSYAGGGLSCPGRKFTPTDTLEGAGDSSQFPPSAWLVQQQGQDH